MPTDGSAKTFRRFPPSEDPASVESMPRPSSLHPARRANPDTIRGRAVRHHCASPPRPTPHSPQPLPLRLLVPREHIIRALPGREEVEVPELLGQLHGLVHDPSLRVVVANLDVA